MVDVIDDSASCWSSSGSGRTFSDLDRELITETARGRAAVTLDAACVRPGDPPWQPSWQPKWRTILYLTGRPRTLTKPLTCTDRRWWMRLDTLRRA